MASLNEYEMLAVNVLTWRKFFVIFGSPFCKDD